MPIATRRSGSVPAPPGLPGGGGSGSTETGCTSAMGGGGAISAGDAGDSGAGESAPENREALDRTSTAVTPSGSSVFSCAINSSRVNSSLGAAPRSSKALRACDDVIAPTFTVRTGEIDSSPVPRRGAGEHGLDAIAPCAKFASPTPHFGLAVPHRRGAVLTPARTSARPKFIRNTDSVKPSRGRAARWAPPASRRRRGCARAGAPPRRRPSRGSGRSSASRAAGSAARSG